MSRTDPDRRRGREPHPWPPPRRGERRLFGIPACAGVAIGPVFRTTEAPPQVTRHRIQAADAPAEVARLEAAILQSRKQLLKLRARLSVLPEEGQGEIAPLLDAYLQMLGPSRLVRGIRARVTERLVSAETGVMEEANALAAAFVALGGGSGVGSAPAAGGVPAAGNVQGARDVQAGSEAQGGGGAGPDGGSAQRKADEVREIGRRLVRNLTRAPFRSFAGAAQGSILIAESLRPSDAALIDPARIAAVATEEGGTDGHTAILLRALGVPAVLGAPGLMAGLRAGDSAIVDGVQGTVTLNPGPATLANARRAVVSFARDRQRLGRLRRLPSETLDGETVMLHANLELPVELPMIANSGATGIGLLRSEFLFMNRDSVPTEDEQAESYRQVVETMGGDPVTIRVLDWGGEKEVEALTAAGLVPESVDANPALGMRGIRLLLRQPTLFEAQLAAILRAAVHGPVRVLLPMVTNVAEVRAARTVLHRVADRLRAAGRPLPKAMPPLGIMIEIPGAALCAHALAAEAEFFAIGTNDLCMYALAVDRGETDVAELYDPLHPAMLQLIRLTAEARGVPRHPGVGLRGDGGQPGVHAAADRPGAALLQHQRLRRAAGEAGGARHHGGRLPAPGLAGHEADRPGAHARAAGDVRAVRQGAAWSGARCSDPARCHLPDRARSGPLRGLRRQQTALCGRATGTPGSAVHVSATKSDRSQLDTPGTHGIALEHKTGGVRASVADLEGRLGGGAQRPAPQAS